MMILDSGLLFWATLYFLGPYMLFSF